jgi:hypothetical protein
MKGWSLLECHPMVDRLIIINKDMEEALED